MTSAAEKKFFDYNINGPWDISSGGSVFPIGYPSQGGNVNQRIGDQMTIHRITVRFQWFFPAVSPDNYNQCRLMLVEWRDRTVSPTLGDILAAVPTFTEPAAFRTWSRRTSYNMLMDKHTLLDSRMLWSTKIHTKNIRKFHKTITFASGGVTPQDYYLYFVACSDSSAPGYPQLQAQVRIVYTDA